MKSLTPKKPSKDQRERLILFGLVELYLQTGKPIGSNTLKENGFDALSSATIRNYFTKLEEEGYVLQQHSSGGRIPSALAFKAYAEAHLELPLLSPEAKQNIEKQLYQETHEVAAFLHRAAKIISDLTQCAVFLSAPRFDQDFILSMKLVAIDETRLLCVIITNFGMVHSEMLYIDQKRSPTALKGVEAYLQYRLTGIEKPKLSTEEEATACSLYKELLLRHIVSYTHFSAEDLSQAGFSKLLSYPDFNEAAALAGGLSLFEDQQMLRQLLKHTCEREKLSCWIGEDIKRLNPDAAQCSILTVPYRIHQSICGAIGILGPNRIPYRELFGQLEQIAHTLSQSLTKSLYKFKITYRTAKPTDLQIDEEPHTCLEIEDKGRKL